MSQPLTAALTTYLVGGAVRDRLLNRPYSDHDHVVVGATPEQMLSLGFKQVGKDFPVFLHPETKEEYALARTERKQGQGYTGFVCYAEPDVTLEQDLIRRDLTINAMALSTSGELIDPYGGQQDIAQRVLRHVSDAFIEDPLRVLRVARFASRFHQLGFTIADETLALMTQLCEQGELQHLSAERIWQEIHSALTQANPEVFIKVLQQVGALKIIWPELDKLWGVPNPKVHHPEICSGKHTLLVVQQAALLTDDVQVRFAALCHDLGKGLTLPENYPAHIGHEQAGLTLINNLCQRLRVPTAFKQLALAACEFHLHSHRALELKPATILKLFNRLDIWRKPEFFQQFLLVCEADFRGRLGFENRDYPQRQYLLMLAEQALTITARQFVEQGIQGEAIKQAMHKARLDRISEQKQHYLNY